MTLLEICMDDVINENHARFQMLRLRAKLEGGIFPVESVGAINCVAWTSPETMRAPRVDKIDLATTRTRMYACICSKFLCMLLTSTAY